jgi:hypothetical protein
VNTLGMKLREETKRTGWKGICESGDTKKEFEMEQSVERRKICIVSLFRYVLSGLGTDPPPA